MSGNKGGLRHFITLVPDDSDKDAIDWNGMAKTMAKSFLVPGYGAYAYYKYVRGLIDDGLDISIFSISDGEKKFSFSPGHPKVKVIYAQHPVNKDLYYPISLFHRKVFEHKFSEALRLLSALGAQEVYVEYKKGWSTERVADISSSGPVSGVSIDGKVSAEVGAKESEQLKITLSLIGHNEPKLPDGMVWYQHEPTWISVADARINFGLKDFSLTLSYEEDYQINASLKAKVEKTGLELGGKFEDHQATVWQMRGVFGPA